MTFWAEDDPYLDEMKGMQKIWGKCIQKKLKATATMEVPWVLSDEGLKFGENGGDLNLTSYLPISNSNDFLNSIHSPM